MKRFLGLAAFFGALAFVGVARAEAPPRAHPLDAQDVEAWLDGYMPAALKERQIAGAEVVIVKDGAVLLEKGYGVADVATGRPVDPKTTLFRPGSISKLFTWTAVMQQVEAGRLNLDADINTYLDFRIPPRRGEPITLRQLMNHTPGFEETIKGLFTEDPKRLDSLEKALKAWTPHRIFAPGSTPAYSNYGAALAGYIVQRVSGEAFDAYVERHIFAPLGMSHASFRQPLPKAIEADMSKGYATTADKPKPYELIPLTPSGALAASGDDIGRFMLAHLQDGRLGNANILRPETARSMHDTVSQATPPMNGHALGFYRKDINGHRVIAHGGDTLVFHSDLALFLDDGVGLYITTNSAGKPGVPGSIRGAVFEGFADRYFPAAQPAGSVDAKTAAAHAALIAGNYTGSRRSDSNFLAITNPLSELTFIANADHTISIDGPKAYKHYREVSPFVWQEVGGHNRFTAVLKDGKVVRVGSDDFAFGMVLDRTPAHLSGAWIVPALGAALGTLLLTAIVWPAAVIVRARYGRRFELTGARASGYRAVRLATLTALAALGLWGVYLAGLNSTLGVGQDGWLRSAQILSLVGIGGGLIVALYNLTAVWRGPSSWFGKVWSLALVLAFAVLTYVGVAFHLIGFATNF